MDISVGQLLASLPLGERLNRYRLFSQQALQQAANTQDTNLRAGYLSMAAGWHVLADEIERAMDRFDVLQKTHDTPSGMSKRD